LSGQIVGEHTPIHRWIGLLIGFCGLAITVGARIDFTDAESVFVYLIPFGSVMALTAAGLIQRRLEVHHQSFRLPVDVALFYQSMATMLVLSIPAVCMERLETRWELDLWIALLWLILGVSIAAYALMWRLIARMDATRVASLFYLGPAVTMIMAWAAFGDTIRWMDAVGLAIVAAGVLLTQLPMPRFIPIAHPERANSHDIGVARKI
jgi:drug/metabolite transporter (DMT)-like permease